MVALALSLGGSVAAATAQTSPAAQAPAAQAPAAMAPAPPPPIVIPDDITQPAIKLTDELTAAEAVLENNKERDEDLVRIRNEIQEISTRSRQSVEQLKPRLEAIRQQIAKLGPPPAKDAPAESDQIAHERLKLNALAAAIDGAMKTADLLSERASQVIDRIQLYQRELFTRSVLKRTQSPLLPALWIELTRESQRGVGDVRRLLSNWWSIAEAHEGPLAALSLFLLVLWAGLRFLVRRLIRAHRNRHTKEPSFFGKATAAAWVAPALALPPIVAMAGLYLGLDHFDLLHLGMNRLATTAVQAVIAFCSVTALAAALLTPRRPDWRLFNLSDVAAGRIRWLMFLIASVYAIDLFLKELSNVIYAPLSVTIAQSFLAGMAFSGLLIALLRTPFGAADMGPSDAPALVGDASPTEVVEARDSAQIDMFRSSSTLEPRWLKLPLWLVAIGIILAALLGYVSLARFLSGQIVVTGSILVAVILLHHAIKAIAGDLVDPEQPGGFWLTHRLGFDESRRRQLALLLSVLLNSGLVLLAAPLVLLQWGFDWAVVKGWLTAAMFGFKVGSVEISLARILSAVAILMAGLFATRMLQRSLDQTVLLPQRMDVGIANSVRTAVGYAGVGAASLIAVSYAGLDFTNLAIVAGALSVGIGFGLQSVVNNFVSGLILLVERPVKVGDWIVVGADEGHVRRISVRSTEIETFDRSSVIIPNADLIQGRVKNWTLRDSVGRVRLNVGVSYNSDPAMARDILLKVAGAHPAVLKFPAPSVSFESFGPSAIELAVFLFVNNVNQGGTVKAELAFQILKAFREAGIEMPFPQQEVHLRSLEPFRGQVARAIDEHRQHHPSAGTATGTEGAMRPPTPLKTV